MSENTDTNEFESWAIVELLGHVRLAGLVSEEEHFGGKMGRVDVPVGDGYVTQYFGHGSIYRVTPCTEEMAKAVAQHNKPRPIDYLELEVSVSLPEEYDEGF
jgi:hypothetical protein